jgi:ABC-2 type transport system ATP-binding protein/lipopolysaccharide transport system ATP-binding protein
MEDYAIEVKNVSLEFCLYSENVSSIKEYFIKKVKREISKDSFWALKDISFNVKKGEAVGLVGKNGCGKSTMLKTIAGVLTPTMGTVKVNGTVAPMIELGAGFDPELTARENIFLNGAILGYPQEMLKERFDEIIDFAELKDFVDVPVKNFSSGMTTRLGFSIATIYIPDILIVDEILAVGDFAFQKNILSCCKLWVKSSSKFNHRSYRTIYFDSTHCRSQNTRYSFKHCAFSTAILSNQTNCFTLLHIKTNIF